MDKYYVNDHAQASGDHEVHKDGCYWLFLAKSTTYLGYHYGCATAVTEAKSITASLTAARIVRPPATPVDR